MAKRGAKNCKRYNVGVLIKEMNLLVWLLLSVQQNTWWYAALYDWIRDWKDVEDSDQNMVWGISYGLLENTKEVQEKQFKIVDPLSRFNPKKCLIWSRIAFYSIQMFARLMGRSMFRPNLREWGRGLVFEKKLFLKLPSYFMGKSY